MKPCNKAMNNGVGNTIPPSPPPSYCTRLNIYIYKRSRKKLSELPVLQSSYTKHQIYLKEIVAATISCNYVYMQLCLHNILKKLKKCTRDTQWTTDCWDSDVLGKVVITILSAAWATDCWDGDMLGKAVITILSVAWATAMTSHRHLALFVPHTLWYWHPHHHKRLGLRHKTPRLNTTSLHAYIHH